MEPRIYNKKIGSSISGVGKTGQPHNINSETGLLFYTTDSKYIEVFNIRPEMVKLEEK